MFWGYALVGVAAILWGSSAGAVRAFVDHTDASGIVLAFAEAVLAAPLLIVASAVAGGAWPDFRSSVRIASVTGLFVGGFLASYFTAIGSVGITPASLVAICSAPLFTAILATMFLRERPSRGMIGALIVGVTGTALVLVSQASGPAFGVSRTSGILLALVAGFCFGAENVAVRRLVATHRPIPIATLTTLGTIVVLAPLALSQGGIVHASIEGWPWLLYLVVLPTALAPVLHNTGLRTVTALSAAIVGLIEPLTAVAIGLVLFDETIGPLGLLGAACLLVAMGMVYATQRSTAEDFGGPLGPFGEPLEARNRSAGGDLAPP